MDAAYSASWQKTLMVMLSVLGFAFIYPFAIDLFDGEAAQVVFGAVLGMTYGYTIGYVLPGRSKFLYFAVAVVVGLAAWAAVLLYASVLYAGAPLLGVWFFRFGLATALLFAGGALVGDLVRRQKFALASGAFAAGIALAGLIVSILQLLG